MCFQCLGNRQSNLVTPHPQSLMNLCSVYGAPEPSDPPLIYYVKLVANVDILVLPTFSRITIVPI
jgi:hypothetical protein